MKKLTILVFAICCLSCMKSHSQTKVERKYIDSEAITLNHQANELYFNYFFDRNKPIGKLKSAIDLVNKAILVDSDFYAPYNNKMVFQDELNQYDSTILTAKLIIKKWPKNEQATITLGQCYELKGDPITAFEWYRKALSEINDVLASADIDINLYKLEQHEKAKVLILVNQPDEAKVILKDLIARESNETIKSDLDRMIFENRREVLLQKPVSLN